MTSTGPSFSFPRYKDIVMGVSHETCLVYVSQGSVYCLSDSIREIRLASCALSRI